MIFSRTLVRRPEGPNPPKAEGATARLKHRRRGGSKHLSHTFHRHQVTVVEDDGQDFLGRHEGTEVHSGQRDGNATQGSYGNPSFEKSIGRNQNVAQLGEDSIFQISLYLQWFQSRWHNPQKVVYMEPPLDT